MELPGKRHWKVKEENQRTRKHTSAEKSRPGDVFLILACRSSCTSSWASRRSQVGEVLSFQVACSTSTVWTRRQNRGTLCTMCSDKYKYRNLG
eukprot:1158289-Pelagomonas_calceolata.AAC.6